MTAPEVEEPAVGLLDLSCSQHAGEAVVRVSGELDALSSHRLRRVLGELLRQPLTRIAVDMSDVTFMDSAGLGALLANRVAAERVGVELVLVECSSPVARLLDLTGTASRLVGGPTAPV